MAKGVESHFTHQRESTDFSFVNLCVLTSLSKNPFKQAGLWSFVMRNASPSNTYSTTYARRILPGCSVS